ncbi:MAG: hypothetical protein EZS26_002478 [Candidatus Ordinivivax streblomastigis]|jgi:bifunctional DNase/RNase|uniref:BFN domain-containing protein n=1 Tax=Candidatus Ordinivivax streblomastigis TaxID=2540710 RepID=A0A5M8NZ07_9BACT|nr:MAG: hypothetical protein EZS26_002478 [Candidatus Ordinivivax streblomastigis]MDR2843206.1 bifunctional nuclease family protein [Candidatus Symbiothrix sp.]
MIALQVLGITFSQVQAGAYALILAEMEGNRRVPVIIGTPEAQSIAIYLEKLNPPRPLTHDLFIAFAQKLHVKLVQINIYKYQEGIFYSEMIFNTGEKTFQMDARTSDAIALAVRNNTPIYIADEIMDEVGVVMDEDDGWDEEHPLPEKKTKISKDALNMEELQKELNEAIASEDFEAASSIHELMKKLK